MYSCNNCYFLFVDRPLVSSEAGTLYNPVSKLIETEKQVSSSSKQLTSIEKISVSFLIVLCMYIALTLEVVLTTCVVYAQNRLQRLYAS